MDRRCKECRKWEEHFYWNHFEATRKRFFKVLVDDFSKSLSIPKKFVFHFKDHLPKEIKLKGPSGNAWNINLKRGGDGVFFTGAGWGEFVEDHVLQKGDFLVFRYTGDSCFKVKIFDISGCEKEHSYFVREKKQSAKAGKACPSQERRVKSPELLLRRDQNCNSTESSNTADAAKASHNKPASAGNARTFRPTVKRQYCRRSGRSTSGSSKEHQIDEAEDDFKDDAKPSKPIANSVTKKRSCSSYAKHSTRRPATAEEKQKALSLARSVKLTHPAFIAVMRQTNVFKSFVLALPTQFAAENLPRRDQNVLLRLPNGEVWQVRYIVNDRIARFGMGWRKFAVENRLELDDVCLFQLRSTEMSNNLVLEVKIFRVVDAVIDLLSDERRHKRRLS